MFARCFVYGVFVLVVNQSALGRASSARDHGRSSTSTLPTGYNNHHIPKQNGMLEPGEVADNVASSLHKAALYVLGEKNHVKVSMMRPVCEFFSPELLINSW